MNVFISYSHTDAQHARHLASALESNEIDYFLDEKLDWGTRLTDAVRHRLRGATHLVVLLSPASMKSGWVNFELGVAEGRNLEADGQLRILPWMVYPVDAPDYIRGRLYKTDLASIIAYFQEELRRLKVEDPLHSFIRDHGFHRAGTSARALRLIGAADETFPASEVSVEVSRIPYQLPPEFIRAKPEIIDHLEARAKESGAPFHNGPHTRLVDYSVSSVDPKTEQKRLTLTLGPVNWYDYSVVRHFTDSMNPEQLRSFINLDEVAAQGTMRSSRLHNILDTVTTLVTEDCYLLYSHRGKRVSVGKELFTSAVAENIHQEKDASLSLDQGREPYSAAFRAAIRGVDEELSPLVAEPLASGAARLVCLGLSFDLGAYHPDIIFFAAMPLSLREVLEACSERPGVDFFEGKLHAHSLIDDMDALNAALRLPNWTGGGKASVFRALEYLETSSARRRQPLADLIRSLAFPNE